MNQSRMKKIGCGIMADFAWLDDACSDIASHSKRSEIADSFMIESKSSISPQREMANGFGISWLHTRGKYSTKTLG